VNTVAVPLESAGPGSRRRALLWLVASQALMLFSLVPWFIASGFSLIGGAGGDQPGLARMILFVVWAYPLVPLVFSIAAWVAFARRKYRKAIVLTSIPLALTLPLLAYLGYMLTG
jgi:hypothetical protein